MGCGGSKRWELGSSTRAAIAQRLLIRKKESPARFRAGLSGRTLAATYSDMAYGHTTIGAERFHFRVRNGIGWFPFAITARENLSGTRKIPPAAIWNS